MASRETLRLQMNQMCRCSQQPICSWRKEKPTSSTGFWIDAGAIYGPQYPRPLGRLALGSSSRLIGFRVTRGDG
jgi:hypothetical protein